MDAAVQNDTKVGKSGLIIYDGACGACSLFVGERKSFFEKHGFSVAPLQAEHIPSLTGLDEATLLQSIHLLSAEGEILRGADFFHYVAGKVWWLAPIHLVLKIPAIKKMFAKLYDFIAQRRRNIAKVCGYQSRAKYPL